MVASLVLYALLGGADYGGGVWDLFAFGRRAREQRELIAHAIGPVWEANHVWLILVLVILFTAFPPAFAVIATALHIPITLLLRSEEHTSELRSQSNLVCRLLLEKKNK